MKRAIGETRALLKVLGEIQTLAGMAANAFRNDRDPMRAEHVLDPLSRIFELCLRERDKFDVVS